MEFRKYGYLYNAAMGIAGAMMGESNFIFPYLKYVHA
jgi:hypothetical protein